MTRAYTSPDGAYTYETMGVTFNDRMSLVQRVLSVTTDSAKIEYKDGTFVDVDLYNAFVRSDNRKVAPVVYLDQKLWIRLSQSIHAPHKVSNEELIACARIIELAETRKIILPLSEGHFMETTGGAERLKLAHLMLRLSRGWLMRFPYKVRDFEILRAVGIEVPCNDHDSNSETITLEPWSVLLVQDPYLHERNNVISATENSLLWVATLHDHFGEDAHIKSDRSHANLWADAYNELGEHLGTISKSKRDRTIHSHLVQDLIPTLNVVLNKDFQVDLESPDSKEAILDMPFFGRYYQYMSRRLRNPQHKWVSNDFADITFLTCAAGYSDFIVTERQAAKFLHDINHELELEAGRKEGAVVFTDLSPLVHELDKKITR